MLKVFDLSFAQMRELFDLTPYASYANKKFLYTRRHSERGSVRVTLSQFSIVYEILHRSTAYLSVTKM